MPLNIPDKGRRLLNRIRWLRSLPRKFRKELAGLRCMEMEVVRIAGAIQSLQGEQAALLANAVDRLQQGNLARILHTLESMKINQVIDLEAMKSQQVSDLAQALQRVQEDLAGRILPPLEALKRQQVPDLAKPLQQVQNDLSERFLLLETTVRQTQRAAAEAALCSRYAPPQERAEGVSVLIPCWNQGSLLSKAVASALAAVEALDSPGEVIILDDASRDSTRQVALEWAHKDSRVRLLATDDNLGLPRARNVMLRQARFHHAMMLDADNRLVPTGVAALHRAARQTGAVLTYGTMIWVDETGQARHVGNNDRVTPTLTRANQIDAMAMVRTERLLEMGGYDPDSRVEDWEMHARLLHLREPICFVPTFVGWYRVSPLSMTNDTPGWANRFRRVERLFALDGLLKEEEICACTYHPATGYLWQAAAWQKIGGAADQAPPTSPSTPRILVVSSGGVANLGDDAILLATLERLQRLRPGCIPEVVSDGEKIPPLGRLGLWAGTTAELCHSLEPGIIQAGCANHQELAHNLPERVQAQGSRAAFAPVELSTFEVILFAGGGNLASHWPDLTARRTAIAAAASALEVPYLLSGQGVGPVTEEIAHMLAALVEGAQQVGVRDPVSAELLRQLGVATCPVDVVGDDAMGLRPVSGDRLERRLAQAGIPRDIPLLAFQAREIPEVVGFSREELLATAQVVDQLAAHTGRAVLCIPTNSQGPFPETELLAQLARSLKRRQARWYLVDCVEDVALFAGVISKCQAVITYSYHMALFALEKRIPTLMHARTEYYRRKARGMQEYFGVPGGILLPDRGDSRLLALRLERQASDSWSEDRAATTVDRWLDQGLPGQVAHPGRLPLAA